NDSNVAVYGAGSHRDLPSFPTRRSSDLAMVTGTRSLNGESETPIDAVLAAIAAVNSLPPADAIVEHIALDGDVEEGGGLVVRIRSEEHTSELQSRSELVCRPPLEKKK